MGFNESNVSVSINDEGQRIDLNHPTSGKRTQDVLKGVNQALRTRPSMANSIVLGCFGGNRLLSLEVLESIRCKTHKSCRSGYRLALYEMFSTLDPCHR